MDSDYRGGDSDNIMIGNKVKITNCKRPTHSGCNGLIGIVVEQGDFNGSMFYTVEAINKGAFIDKHFMWNIGNKADFLREELQIL